MPWRNRFRIHHFHVALFVGNVGVVLHPYQEAFLMVDAKVGQSISYSLEFLDQHGQPIAVTPDAAPEWSDTTPATEALTQSSDGLSAHGAAIAVGQDTVAVKVVVGGKEFDATIAVNVTEAPPVLTSVAIVAKVS